MNYKLIAMFLSISILIGFVLLFVPSVSSEVNFFDIGLSSEEGFNDYTVDYFGNNVTEGESYIYNMDEVSITYKNPDGTYTTQSSLEEINILDNETYRPIILNLNETNIDFLGNTYAVSSTYNKYQAYLKEQSSEVSSEPVRFLKDNYTITITPNSLKFLGQTNNHKKQSLVNVSGSMAVYDGQFGEGIDLKYIYGTNQLMKLLQINSLQDLKDNIKGSPNEDDVLELKFTVKVYNVNNESDATNFKDGSNRVNFKTELSDVSTDEDLIFVDDNNETIYYFPRPYIFDSIENINMLNYTYDINLFNNLVLKVQIPYTLLESAVYPVYIDPTIALNTTLLAPGTYTSSVYCSNFLVDTWFRQPTGSFGTSTNLGYNVGPACAGGESGYKVISTFNLSLIEDFAIVTGANASYLVGTAYGAGDTIDITRHTGESWALNYTNDATGNSNIYYNITDNSANDVVYVNDSAAFQSTGWKNLSFTNGLSDIQDQLTTLDTLSIGIEGSDESSSTSSLCLNGFFAPCNTYGIPASGDASKLYVTYYIPPLDPEVDRCGYINESGTYTLQNNLSTTTESCIIINASDVLFEGQGFTIDGPELNTYDGVQVLNANNVTVQNLDVTDFAYNFYLEDVSESYFYNITGGSGFESGGRGGYSFRIDNVTNSIFDNFTSVGNERGGINMEGIPSSYNVFTNFDINGSQTNSGAGIYIFPASGSIDYNNFTNGIIRNIIKDGIYILRSADYNLFSGLEIEGSGRAGIYFEESGGGEADFNLIYNNIFNNTVNYQYEVTRIFDNYWNTTYSTDTSIIGTAGFGGNYWTNSSGTGYSDTCAVTITNYICDVPFNVSSQTECVGCSGINIDEFPLSFQTAGDVDNEYPQFSNPWDNNATLIDSGIGLFNITITSTNGSAFLEIDGNNYTATNISEIYNASASLTSGTYPYYWGAWGNGTSTNYNISNTYYYTVNASADSCTYGGSGDWNIDCSEECSIDTSYDVDGDVYFSGNGLILLQSKLNFIGSNQFVHLTDSCKVHIESGGGFN